MKRLTSMNSKVSFKSLDIQKIGYSVKEKV